MGGEFTADRETIDMSEIARQISEAIVRGIPRYSLVGLTLYGKAVSLYDGDTFDVAVYNNNIERHTVRMIGYNAEEIRQPVNLPADVRKQLALKAQMAKNELATLLGLNLSPDIRPLLRLECGQWDKYGRLLAVVYNNDESINDKMSLYCKSLS
jgi:endonuclease YncB( thermonuclease family)